MRHQNIKTNKINKENEKKLAAIHPGNRILLLSHCLRPSKDCPARMSKDGLLCTDDCKVMCVLGRLRKLAKKLNYKGICIAPGGSMAVKFVKKNQPQGIIAIACTKELKEGVCAVREIVENNNRESENGMPVIVTIPLTKDGCVDTEVDEEEATRIINL